MLVCFYAILTLSDTSECSEFQYGTLNVPKCVGMGSHLLAVTARQTWSMNAQYVPEFAFASSYGLLRDRKNWRIGESANPCTFQFGVFNDGAMSFMITRSSFTK